MISHDHLEPMPADTSDTGAQTMRPKPPAFWRSKTGMAAIGFLLIAAFLLVLEHRAHALGYLPFLLIFGSLFMHMFMHGGHSGHSGHSDGKPAAENSKLPSQGA